MKTPGPNLRYTLRIKERQTKLIQHIGGMEEDRITKRITKEGVKLEDLEKDG